ncbi:MAG: PQQ-binding-like beta-propeller repeat protein [Gemmataceae bacterium]|nr:PQQ-binding-like beta-propeller repeat protein [Gemmataceae bacterium]
MTVPVGQLVRQSQQATSEAAAALGGRRLRTRWPLMMLLACMPLLGVGEGQAASPADEQNWPQWRGPLQNGVAPQADPPTEWSETKNVKWKVKIPGKGSATPVVWENKVFVLTAIPTGKRGEPAAAAPAEPRPPVTGTPPAGAGQRGPARGGQGRPGGFGGRGGQKPTEVHQFVLLCLDRQTGKVLWQQVARAEVPHEGHHPSDGNFAAASPVTDGKHVIASFGSRGLYCYDLDGKLQWSQDLGDMRIALGFGEGCSPTLCGDALIVKWDHEGESFLVALDKKTGKTLWKQPRAERTSWATPLVVEHDGKRQIVTAASGKIRSYDAATGKLVWECAGLTSNVIPSPVASNGVVYCMSGYRGNALLALRLDRTGDLAGTDAVVWRHNKSTPYVPSPLLYGDKLYFFAVNNGILSCFDAKAGQALIDAQRVEGLQNVYASPIGASGRVYLVGRNGVSVVIKHADKLEVLATNRLQERFDASPAVAGKELFLRGQEHLYCIAEK